jgi:hypothetical protein
MNKCKNPNAKCYSSFIVHHSSFADGPVVQWRRPLVHIQVTMVRVHPGSLRGGLERRQQGLISPSTRVRFPLPQL